MFQPLLRPPLEPMLRSPMGAGTQSELSRAISLLRRLGSNAHVYLPGATQTSYGPELFPALDSPSGWTLVAGASVGSGAITFASAAAGTSYKNIGAIAGKDYSVTFTVSSSSGSVQPVIGGQSGTARTAGTFTETLRTATSSGNFGFNTTSSTTCSVTLVSVREVITTTAVLNGLQAGNYLDSAGTTLGTVDNPVGLVLDANGGLGVELFNFANVAVASGVVITSVNGGYSFNGSAAAAGDDGQCSSVNFTTTANSTYMVQLTINNDAMTTLGSGFFARQGANGTGTIVFASGQCSARTYSFVVQASGTTTSLLFDSALDKCTYAISNIYVREVTGIAASQATTGSKPRLERGLRNLLTWSGDFTNAAWVKVSGATAQAAEGCYKLVAPASTGPDRDVRQTIVGSSAFTSCFLVKASEFSSCYIVVIGRLATGGESKTGINLTTLAQSNIVGSRPITTAMLPDGWVLCAVSSDAVAGSASFETRIGVADVETSTTVTGDGSKGILIKAAGIFAGTYTAQQILANGGIPLTTTAAASNQSAGRYSWSFDGGDSLALGSVPFGMADDHAVIAAAKCDTALNDCQVFSQRGASTTPIVGQLGFSVGVPDAVWRDDAGTLCRPLGGVSRLGQTVVLSNRKTGNDKILRVNGNQPSATNSTAVGATTITSSAIGVAPAASPSNYMSGNIGPVIAIKATLTDAELLLLERLVGNLSGVVIP